MSALANETAPEEPSQLRHDAFLSYATRADYHLVRRVEAFLESFHRLPAPTGVRLEPLSVFVDGSDLKRRTDSGALGSLRDAVRREVKASRSLVVFCNPAAANSAWLADEIAWFLEAHEASQILLVVSEGERVNGDPGNVFPKAVVDLKLHEASSWYDLRGTRAKGAARDEREELLRLAADLMSMSVGVLQPIWWREERRRARFRVATLAGIVVLLAGLVATAGIGFFNVREQRNRAEAATKKAQRALSDSLLRQGNVADRDLLFDAATLYYTTAHQAAPRPEAIRARFHDERQPFRFTHVWTTQTSYIEDAKDPGPAQSLTFQSASPKPREPARVHALVISRDGTRIASGGDDRTLRILDANGKELAKLQHSGPVTAAEFSNDLLLTGDCSGATRVWSARDGAHLRDLPQREGCIRSIAASRDHVAIAGDDRVIEVMDVQAKTFATPIHTRDGAIAALAFSPSRPELLAIAAGSDLVAVDLNANTHLWSACPGGHLTGAASIAFREDGAFLFTGGDGNTLSVWDAAPTDSLRAKLSNTDCYKPVGRLSSKEPSYNQLMIDPQVGPSAGRGQSFWTGLTAPTVGALALVSGRYLVSATTCTAGCSGNDRILTAWDLASREPIARKIVQRASVRKLAVSVTGTFLVVAGDDGAVTRWDLPIREPFDVAHGSPVVAAAPVGDGIVTSSAWTLQRFDTKRRSIWQHHFATTPAGTFGLAEVLALDKQRQQRVITAQAIDDRSEGALVAVGLRDGSVAVLDADKGSVLAEYRSHSSPIESVRFTTGGIVSIDTSGRLVLRDRGGSVDRQVCTLRGFESPTISHDAKYAAGRTAATDVLVQDISGLMMSCTGTTLTLAGLTKSTSVLAFDRTSRRLAAGDAAGNIVVWDITTKAQLARLVEPDSPVQALEFSPDGGLLASGHYGGLLLLWDLPSGELVGKEQVLERMSSHESFEWSAGSDRLFVAGGDNFLHVVPLPERFWLNEPESEVANLQRTNALVLSASAPLFQPPGSSADTP